MVYLVGNSISGQVNPAILGKSTRTYVKKLKAAKIKDLHSMTDQVKDVKMIIIHTGINNLRGKESSADSGKSLIESIISFREAAPESKIVVSKVIRIGDHENDIERNIFNAENEKRLTEINKSGISFIDHGNLAERGIPIKEYYLRDLIHLAGQGVAVFADNLEKEIVRVLKSEEQQLETEAENTAQLSRSRDMNTGNRNHRSYQLAHNGDGQYNQQHKYPEERDQRRNTYRGNQPRMHPDSNGFSGYPSRKDDRDNERQYYRNHNRGNERNYYRDDYRDNDRQHYRSGYNKDNQGIDSYRIISNGNYPSERFNDRDDKYLGDIYFDKDDYYYNGWCRSGHSY